MVKVAFGQYVGMPETMAWYSVSDSDVMIELGKLHLQ
jgi:hypothetical protein